MPNIHTAQGLLEAVSDLRQEVRSGAEELFRVFGPSIERADFVDSAQNLASYLALRRQDLRDLQLALTRWGLSSLGRSESRVQPTLDAVIRTLGAICESDLTQLPAYPTPESLFKGAELLEREASTVFGKAKPERATRIMVTLPTKAANDLPFMEGLLRAGVECVRINCAHDDERIWEGMLRTLRDAELALGATQPVRVLMDLGGPKVRTVRPKKQEKDRYSVGDKLLLTAADSLEGGNGGELAKRKRPKKGLPVVGCSLPEALDRLRLGDRVFIDDGQVGARVLERVAQGVVIAIFQAPAKGRKIRSEKGLNFPDTDFDVASLTTKDRSDLRFVAQHADMVGYSFVQTEADIDALLSELAAHVPQGHTPPAVVLKIETKKAVRALPALIVRAAGKLPTAVMIARGDLAIELGFARIAEMQEEILWLCEAANVPVIWATQVLEGLAKEGLPTRAEVTDAAMAARAECVMLNKGPHVVDAVQMLCTVLSRMAGHQYKKSPQLRVLHSWEAAFLDEAPSLPPTPPLDA